MTFAPERRSVRYKGHSLCGDVIAITSEIILARPCKSGDVIKLKYTDKDPELFLDWISRFQIGFLDFRLDFCRHCTRYFCDGPLETGYSSNMRTYTLIVEVTSLTQR